MASFLPARIAPRVASKTRCWGTSAARTAWNSRMAASESPDRSLCSAHKMQPSATAERTSGAVEASAGTSSLAASSPPMRPSATAAAEATSGSASFNFSARISTALASRRIPRELITPTKRRPCNFPAASRSAAAAAAPGIASNAMRDHAASFSSDNSAASAGTDAGPPHRANCLQAIALSCGGVSGDTNAAMKPCSFSAAASSAPTRVA